MPCIEVGGSSFSDSKPAIFIDFDLKGPNLDHVDSIVVIIVAKDVKTGKYSNLKFDTKLILANDK